jgi:hypothetical protein
MSSSAKLPVSAGLRTAFTDATKNPTFRFLHVVIQGEELVSSGTGGSPSNTAEHDFQAARGSLQPTDPVYIPFNYDCKAPRRWIMLVYVPAASKVKDRMLYGAAR